MTFHLEASDRDAVDVATFRIEALAPDAFRPLFALDDAALAACGAVRRVADVPHAFPCRVSLEDAEPGEELILAHFAHHAVASPYAASGPVFVRRAALDRPAAPPPGHIPDQLKRRLLSVRAYDGDAMMVTAEVMSGTTLAEWIESSFADRRIAYIHAHFARHGCYAARVLRA